MRTAPSASPRTRSAPPSGRGRTWLPFAVAAVVLAGTLALAYAGKAACLDGETGFWSQNRYCYSDVRVLWGFRGFDVDALPYAGPPPDYPDPYTLEYPPALAFPAWLIGVATSSRTGFFNLHALTFVAAAGVALWQGDRALRHIGDGRRSRSGSRPPSGRWRLLGFALSPGLVLFGFQNWDLWSVALVAAGLAAAVRRRPYLASVWFAVAAAVKWWPALLVVTLLAGPWRPRPPDPGDDDPWPRWLRPAGVDLRPAAVAAGVWALAQLPALIVSPSGWWASITFHIRRGANLDSAAAAIADFGADVVASTFWEGAYSPLYTTVSLGVLAAGVVYVTLRLRRGDLDPGDAALALVALFLLTGKVFSPQFVLWLLPVAVISRVSWTPVLAVEAANAAVWLLYGPWMAHLGDPAFDGFLRASQGMALVRAAAVLWLVVAALLPDERRERLARLGSPAPA